MITKQNKKGNVLAGILITLGILIAIALIIGSWMAGNYNTLVQKDTTVEAQFGKVKVAMERRLDLLPNLAATVKGSANFEKDTLVQVAQARGGLRVSSTPSQLDEANKPITAMMYGMLSYTEQYPQLKSTEAFKALMDEIAGSENRIAFERNNYNDVVREYKSQVRSFPSNLIAGMFNFEQSKWDTFEAHTNASVAPTIDFSK
jgi:LemA protein